MTNEEAFEKAMKLLCIESWEPIWAFNHPMRVMWMCIRITQVADRYFEKPKSYKHLIHLEKKLKKELTEKYQNETMQLMLEKHEKQTSIYNSQRK